jgi:hypothetical protein
MLAVLGVSNTPGESENHGIEQERLNAVRGARLRITALRVAHGPGIELLEYRSPQGGRPYPADAVFSDLVHWQTALAVPRLGEAEAALRRANAAFVSPGAVELGATPLRFSRSVRVADPDGQVLVRGEPRSDAVARVPTPRPALRHPTPRSTTKETR